MHLEFDAIFYYSCLLIAAGVGLYYKRWASIGFQWISLLILLTLVSEVTAKFISFFLDKNGIVYHFFIPIEYTVYLIIYMEFLGRKKWRKRLWWTAIILVIVEITNTIFFQSILEANTNVILLESVFLVFLSLTLFLKIRQTPSPTNLIKEGVFWFNSAVLCYYAFSTMFWGFHNMKVYTFDNPPKFIYYLNMILSGLLYITFSVAIYLNALTRHVTRKYHG